MRSVLHLDGKQSSVNGRTQEDQNTIHINEEILFELSTIIVTKDHSTTR